MNKNTNSADVRRLTRATQKSWKVFNVGRLMLQSKDLQHKIEMADIGV